MANKLVIVRGGGDLATGTICRLWRAGYQIIVLEIPEPTVIRHTVALAQCLYTGEVEVEGVKARSVANWQEAMRLSQEGIVPVLIDPAGTSIPYLKPQVVVDAIIAKKNLGISQDWAPIVIGLGPGFTAGKDVHAVVETNRGHNLGRVYYQGSAEPDTGTPGEIAGFDKERIVRSPQQGTFTSRAQIGDRVEEGQVLGYVAEEPVFSPLSGTLRGLINEGVKVKKDMKIGDVDPRQVREYCWTISDKARAIAGGVLEAILYLEKRGVDN